MTRLNVSECCLWIGEEFLSKFNCIFIACQNINLKHTKDRNTSIFIFLWCLGISSFSDCDLVSVLNFLRLCPTLIYFQFSEWGSRFSFIHDLYSKPSFSVFTGLCPMLLLGQFSERGNSLFFIRDSYSSLSSSAFSGLCPILILWQYSSSGTVKSRTSDFS